MNCRQVQTGWLLEQSGELGAGRLRRIEAHTAGCAECRAYREALARLRAAARADEAFTALDPHFASRLHAALATRGASAGPFAAPGRLRALRLSAAAVAAAVATATLFAWSLRRGAPAGPDQALALAVTVPDWVDVQLDLLGEELAEISEATAAGGPAAGVPDIDEVATELLELEGIEI